MNIFLRRFNAAVVFTAAALAAATGTAGDRAGWAIILHGGAGSAPADLTVAENQARREGLERALRAGVKLLDSGGSALDAVETTIRILEDDPAFNAGVGAVFNADAQHELDASIMDGSNLACGAVGAATRIRHPISAARRVMTHTRHVLLVGPGADCFAQAEGLELVENEAFTTPSQVEALRRAKSLATEQQGGGTVGCVALDANGNLAAGTSTGGLTNKRPGRLGDTPIVGAGTYADNESCGVSCTGVGEHFIRFAIAHEVSALMKYKGLDLPAAIQEVFDRTLQPGWGGLIAIDARGKFHSAYNTGGMATAAADADGRFEVRWGVEPAIASEGVTSP